MSAEPTIGTRVRAHTTTPTAQRVVIEVTAVVEATAVEVASQGGWYVYGYRTRRGAPRQTMYPNLYFVSVVTS